MVPAWQRSEAAKALLERLEQSSMMAVLDLPTDASDDQKRRKRVEDTRVGALEQPQAIAKTLDALATPAFRLARALASRPLTRVYLTGAGDSWFAGVGVRAVFERLLGTPAEAIEALEYAQYYYTATDPSCVVIAISAGGNSPRALEAVYRARESGAFAIGVTITEPSAMTTETDAYLRVPATRTGWPTQSSTCSIAALTLLAIRLGEARHTASAAECRNALAGLRDLPERVQASIQRTDLRMSELGEELCSAPIHLFAGGGPSLAAASFGAAKVKELCPVHAIAMPLEEYHHYRSQKPGDPLFLIAPAGQSTRRVLDTLAESRRVGGRTITLATEDDAAIQGPDSDVLRLPAVHESLVAIPFSVPLHLYAYHLAMAKFRRGEGYPPGLAHPVE
jgi:glutamine---fructose-6-phosphate transaminase (isomerizing)